MYNDEFDWEKYPGLKDEIQKLTRGSTTVLRTELETREYRNKFVPTKVDSLAKFRALSPRDGDWIRLPNGQGGWWSFVYDSSIADGYKWVFMGGPQIYLYVYDAGTLTTTGTWSDVTGGLAAPSYTTPYTGYYVHIFGHLATSSTANGTTASDLVINGAQATGRGCQDINTIAGYYSSPSASVGPHAIAAGSTIKLQHYTTYATATFLDRWLEARPVRIGPQ